MKQVERDELLLNLYNKVERMEEDIKRRDEDNKKRDELLLNLYNKVEKMEEDNKRRDEDNKKRDELLLNLYNKVEKMEEDNKRRDEDNKRRDEDNKRRDEDNKRRDEDNKKRDELLLNLYNKVQKMEEEIETIKECMADIKQELQSQGNILTKIEVEHGKKLEALFDGYEYAKEKIEEHEEKLKKLDNKNDRQDAEIYYLQSKISS